ncbi:MAG: TOBE domain-containing protein, partial [Rectinemataceae bacterium]|nr:TOBE domain-containing protein [Rectinemataceae bacterium]
YVTHDQAEAMTVSDRVAVMNAGRLMQIGTPFEIYSRPANRFVADFIGRVNFFEGRLESRSPNGLSFVCRSFTLPAASISTGLGEGMEVTLAIRPESLELFSLSESGGIRDSHAEGIITKSVYLGATVEYEIESGGPKPILAVSHDPIRTGVFRPGDSVGIRIPSIAAHVIPRDA